MTKFELVSSVINNTEADDLREYCIYWTYGDKLATVNFPSNSKLASNVRREKEKNPDEVTIYSDGEYMVATLPIKYIKINNPKREMTEEQKNELRDRLRNAREAQS